MTENLLPVKKKIGRKPAPCHIIYGRIFLERFMESEKKQKLVIDGNAFYEIDLRCLEKKRKKQEEAKKRQQKRQRR